MSMLIKKAVYTVIILHQFKVVGRFGSKYKYLSNFEELVGQQQTKLYLRMA